MFSDIVRNTRISTNGNSLDLHHKINEFLYHWSQYLKQKVNFKKVNFLLLGNSWYTCKMLHSTTELWVKYSVAIVHCELSNHIVIMTKIWATEFDFQELTQPDRSIAWDTIQKWHLFLMVNLDLIKVGGTACIVVLHMCAIDLWFTGLDTEIISSFNRLASFR